MNQRIQVVQNIKKFLQETLEKRGFYGIHFLDSLDNTVVELERLEKALTGVDPEHFEVIFRMAYEAAASSIPLEEALAQHIHSSKKV